MREKSGLCLAGIDYEWPCHLAPRERWCETIRPHRRIPHKCIRSGVRFRGPDGFLYVFHRREKPIVQGKRGTSYEREVVD